MKPYKLFLIPIIVIISTFNLNADIIVPFEESGPIVISHGSRESNMIALTIDDGWEPNWELVDFLNQEDLKVSAFLIGKIIPINYEWVEALYETGAELCNHGYTHQLLDRMDSSLVSSELVETNILIEDITGSTVKYFRPSGGFVSSELLTIAESHSLQIILWDSDVKGYDMQTSAAEQFEELKLSLEGGNIILSHFDSDSNIVEVLELFVPYARSRGYKFVTLSEMFAEDF